MPEQIPEASVVSVLQATIDTLQEQLAVKDRQIEKLTEALMVAQQTGVAAQALHAGTIQQQLVGSEEERVIKADGIHQKACSNGWLSRLFQKIR